MAAPVNVTDFLLHKENGTICRQGKVSPTCMHSPREGGPPTKVVLTRWPKRLAKFQNYTFGQGIDWYTFWIKMSKLVEFRVI